MTQPLHVQEQALRLAIKMASIGFANALTASANNIRHAASDDAFLAALRDQPRETLNALADLIEETNSPPPQLP